MRSNTRYFAVLVLLIGFLTSNQVLGICMPMLTDYLTESHSSMDMGCCDSTSETSNKDQETEHRSVSHDCDCCGCGLQTDESTFPSGLSEFALVTTQTHELLNGLKTIQVLSFITIHEYNSTLDGIISSFKLLDRTRFFDTHSPPLFILYEVLLN